MYWPSGVPRVYAHRTRPDPNDGVEPSGDDGGTDVEGGEGKGSSVSRNKQSEATVLKFNGEAILDVRFARSDAIFATISSERLSIWSSRPTTVLISHVRSAASLKAYGYNAAVHFRPDSSLVVVQTTQGFLITYAIDSDASARVYQQQYQYSQARRESITRHFGTDEANGLPELNLRFRRAIKIDAGINSVLALDQELIIATSKPSAIQCIKWEPHKAKSQASAQLLSKMSWVMSKTSISSMSYDRAMNLLIWIGQDGGAYAVRRIKPNKARLDPGETVSDSGEEDDVMDLFSGYRFHNAESEGTRAKFATINARFSLIAISTAENEIWCYAAKDYAGNVPFSHKFTMPASSSTTGAITCLNWSPDGYCLFAGFEAGFATWSVFGKEGASSFNLNSSHAEFNDEKWLLNVATGNWSSGGAELVLTCKDDNRIWRLEMSRSAAAGCFSCANLVRALLQTPTELTIYRGHELPDLTSISNDASLWHHAQYPASYLQAQWPIKACVVSQDGRYIAISGRRGLAHYSVQSGRWKTFSDPNVENSFAVRGGMCWFNHILAAATEFAGGYDVRLYSRDLELGRNALSQELLSTPVAFIGPSGEDSLLVYTYENVLYHYILSITNRGAQLVQVGQIAFHGVVRAPSRVRSVSWILPDNQIRNGDPSRDVEYASVLFLVDDKLVLLQPSRGADESLRYDMKVIAQHVEYYILMRDQIYFNFTTNNDESTPNTPAPGATLAGSSRSQVHHSLRDSLWIFCGNELKMWNDVRDILRSALEGNVANDLALLSVPLDFYPLSILLTKGVVLGIESELLQRRDVSFAQYRSAIRSQLFIPYILRQQLSDGSDGTAALGLASQYQHLSYFPHAVEILLHHVLDDEVEKLRHTASGKAPASTSRLPNVLSFLQMVLSPTTYLAVIVQCIRKTEITSWKTLFAHLPPPLALFEQALELEDLKTASGYLIVLQGLEEDEPEFDVGDTRRLESHVVRLMKLAAQKADFELCSELARFMIAIDPRGNALRRVIEAAGFRDGTAMGPASRTKPVGLELSVHDAESRGPSSDPLRKKITSEQGILENSKPPTVKDYFSTSPGGV